MDQHESAIGEYAESKPVWRKSCCWTGNMTVNGGEHRMLDFFDLAELVVCLPDLALGVLDLVSSLFELVMDFVAQERRQ